MTIAFEKHPEIGAAFCRHIIMDENGNTIHTSILEQSESGILPENWVEELIGFQRIQTPAIVVRRDVYETLGGFDNRLIYAEDWEMWVRVASSYPVWYETDVLAKYRKNSASITSRNIRSGETIRDLRRAINIIKQDNLSGRVTKALVKHSSQNVAFFGLCNADDLINADDPYGAINQIREAVMLRPNFKVICSAGRIILLDGSRWLWRSLTRKFRGKLDN